MDMAALLRQLRQAMPEAEFSFEVTERTQVLLMLNACRVGCAQTPPFTGRIIVVTPDEVDFWPVRREELAAAVMRRIRGCRPYAPQSKQ